MATPSSVVEVVDARDDERRLRLSWRPEFGAVIVSHWRGNVCVATTRIGVDEIARLIGLLVQALRDAATARSEIDGKVQRSVREAGGAGLLARCRRLLSAAISRRGHRQGLVEEDGSAQAA